MRLVIIGVLGLMAAVGACAVGPASTESVGSRAPGAQSVERAQVQTKPDRPPTETQSPAPAPAPASPAPAAPSGLPSAESLLNPVLPLEVHASQKRLNGPCFFVEVSGARFVKPDNPRGWAWPHFNELPEKGWAIMLGNIIQAQRGGYTSVWLWEPSGQWEGIGGCMAWFSEKTVSDGWSQKMKDSFPAFVRTVRERLGMELIIYSGCANMPNVGTTLRPQLKDGSVDLIPEYLAAARYIAGLGCTGIGMDGYTLLQEKDPAAAVQIIAALRADPATRDLIYVIEGWPAPNASQPYIQQQMVSLDLFRGGHMTEPDNFTKFASRVDRERELRAVPGRVGVWLIHSNPWSDAQLRKGYDLIREWGMVPMDWRTDAPGRFWRR